MRSARRRRTAVAGRRLVPAGLLVAGLVLSRPATAPAQQILGAWDADERVTITDFQHVTALARSSDRLFAATDGGLVVYGDAFERWELPITREDGYPDSQVLALAWDARDGSLWLATRDGRLRQFDVTTRRWLDEIRLGGTVTRIVAPSDDPSVLYVRRGGRWDAVDPFSRQTQSVAASRVRQSISRDFDLRAREELLGDPAWDAARAFLGRRGSERYEITDVMPAAGAAGVFWVATYGGFIERFDSFSNQSETLDYGVIGIGASAVLATDGAVWFAPAYPTDRYGVSTADPGLETWKIWVGYAFGAADRGAPDGPVRAWLRTDDGVWAGGDRGLHRYDGSAWHREPTDTRAAEAPITALAAGPPGLPGVWVGTEHGLFRVRSPGAGADAQLLSASRVRALAAYAGALWVGTDRGLVRFAGRTRPAADSDVATLPMPESDAGPPGRVGALAADGSHLYAGIEGAVWVLDSTGTWSRARPLGAATAPVRALALADGRLWIGTDEGLIGWDTRSDRLSTYTFAAGDLPTGPRGERGVTAVSASSSDEVWAATPAGAVRLDVDR
ncbi:MAG: hypothetical protein PVF05_08000 [Gemmatimonadales bacterium]